MNTHSPVRSSKKLDSLPRILAGKWKMRQLEVASDIALRPTLVRHRLRLFDWLAPMLSQAQILDLFAGSGALGFEALSRGALRAHFVEKSLSQSRQLKAFGALVGANCEVFNMEASHYLLQPVKMGFDLIFLDPPFAQSAQLSEIIAQLIQKRWLADSAWIYCETPKEWQPPIFPKALSLFREKIFKNVAMRLYSYQR